MKKKNLYVPKEDFRKRLLILRSEIDRVLTEPLTSPDSSLPCAMHLVFNYMWCKRQSDLYKVYYPDMKVIYEKLLRSQGLFPVPDEARLLPTVVDDVNGSDEVVDIPF